MKNPKHRPIPKYYIHPRWYGTIARFDKQGKGDRVKWFNFDTKKWEPSTAWTFRSLNNYYEGMTEIKATTKVIRTGRQ